jgi:hypothetical protein
MNIQKGLLRFLRKNFIYLGINISGCSKIYSYNNFLKYKSILISQNGNLLHFSDCPPKCWKCNYPHKSDFFCSKCKALQKLPTDLNYFDIIGIKKDYEITTVDIQTKYRQLQSLLHPDKFGQKSEVHDDINKL